MESIAKGLRGSNVCKSHEASPVIPFDLVIEILTRLPPKSLMRFKSVSNVWSSLICSQYFTNRYQTVSSAAPRLYMGLSFLDNSHLKCMLISVSPSSDSDITISSFDAHQGLTKRAMRGYITSVFRGLMCIVDEASAQIYNTTTRQLVVLPKIEESSIIDGDHVNKNIKYHIGYDPVQDRYKVVCTVTTTSNKVGESITYLSEQWVFLLGGDISSRWRKIPCQSSHFPLTQGLTIKGRMYYLAWIRDLDHVLVSLDTSSEEISMLQAPEDNFYPLTVTLIECCEKVAILHYIDLEIEGMMKLWVMEDAEKHRWSCKTLVFQSSQVDLFNKIKLGVVGTTRNGEVIFAPLDTACFYIILYDLQKNHMRKVEIKETPNRHLTKFCEAAGFDDVENLIYL
ncbi:hypothetical protein Bca4012_007399 [Brassica carinata]|uniref:F-box domain-containing protein n=2 Tax=Brassica TaxID=3705 RepID=A0ABQ7XCC3_BRANA|nr:F-box protein At4g19940-like [Brassica napus]KAG2291444.1 hypothetical protein Bca52824_038113 [Brassica carinata]KAH0852837.1 hypothetical protein HID58_093661 [Brassica napus]